jgi:hypothetical protein
MRARGGELRERVLQGGSRHAEEGDRQLGHLRLVHRPQHLQVRCRAERGEPRDVVGMDDLQVREMVPDPGFPGAARAGRAGSLDGVERGADRPVAERVEVHLEARLVEGGHVAGELAGVDEVQPGVPSRAAVVIEVGGEHRGGVVLHDAVEHHLHAGRPESPGRVVLAVVEQPLELL